MNSKEKLTAFLNRPSTAAWVFLTPSLASLALFLFLPLAVSFGLAFFDVPIFLNRIQWAGWGNFKELMGDSRFWNALKNTALFTLMSVPLGILLSLLTALYVKRETIYGKSLRSLYYVPDICSMTAMGIVWSILLDPTIGIFAYWTKAAGLGKLLFLKDPDMVLPLVAAMTVWKTFGLNMIILVAALQSIPDVYYEAAQMDGASGLRQFFHITLPSLVPTLGFCVITNTISSFMVFDQTYVMTRGGPLFRTETLAQYIYMRGFSISPFRLGYASSVAFMMFLVILAISLAMYHFFTKKEITGM